MKRKRLIVISILIIAIALSGIVLRQYYVNTKVKIASLELRMIEYHTFMQKELQWLASTQASNGALLFRPKEHGEASVNSYFADIAGRALLTDAAYHPHVANYLRWHFEHLNLTTDNNGLTGTMYHYMLTVENGQVVKEEQIEEYDSVDSYAASFLILLKEYYVVSSDLTLLQTYEEELLLILSALNSTIKDNGLSIAKPGYPVHYVMDNSEVYMGLRNAIELLAAMEPVAKDAQAIQQMKVQCQKRFDDMSQVFHTLLYNEEQQRYEIGLHQDGKILKFSGWEEFYPDATAQLFPMVFGVIAPDSKEAKKLYATFCAHFHWEAMSHVDTKRATFYWGVIAYAASMMQDDERVYAYMMEYQRRVQPNHSYPIYNADAGWLVLAIDRQLKNIRQTIEKLDPLHIFR